MRERMKAIGWHRLKKESNQSRNSTMPTWAIIDISIASIPSLFTFALNTTNNCYRNTIQHRRWVERSTGFFLVYSFTTFSANQIGPQKGNSNNKTLPWNNSSRALTLFMSVRFEFIATRQLPSTSNLYPIAREYWEVFFISNNIIITIFSSYYHYLRLNGVVTMK